MPKAAHAISNHQSEASAHGTVNPNVLKRNQACHQCRRRKLPMPDARESYPVCTIVFLSDAKRPCGTCIRSHRNAVNHASVGVEVPPLDCTFDDVADEAAVESIKPPKSRFEKLESRINELEALLLQTERVATMSVQAPSERAAITTPSQQSAHDSSGSPRSPSMFTTDFVSPGMIPISLSRVNGDPGPALTSGSYTRPLEFGSTTGTPPIAQSDTPDLSPFVPACINAVSSPPSNGAAASGGSPQSNLNNQLLWHSWPPNLPPPDLLHHLVEVFFAFHPHAGLLFHGPTFLTSLGLPPNHANFPHACVLHAISAVGSFYTAAVEQPPLPNFAETPADELFHSRYRRRESRPDSFGERHAKFAKDAIDESSAMGEYLVECLQATVVITWFYHSHARWAEVFLMSGRALRTAVPLGLNMCPPFHSISKSLRAPSILPPAHTVIEDETRRNLFWLAYAGERMHSSGNGWAMSLDDQDISQLLPVRRDQFEQGMLVPPSQRQWAHSKDLLLNHPPEQTDSFNLLIKATILISRVKNFNLRFRSKNYAGEADMRPTPHSPITPENGQRIDPRDTPGFQEIDALVAAFIDGFPRGFKKPINGNIVDSHLFTACMIPQVAIILLHDPHADVKVRGCVSAKKIIVAARAVLDCVYSICSTSFDITLLDNFCSFAWFMTGRVLVRFVRAAKDADEAHDLVTYRTELEFIRIALARVGERFPLAYRYAKMLDDIILKTVGIMDDIPLSFNAAPRFASVANSPDQALVFDVVQDSLDTLMFDNSRPLFS